MSDNQKYGLYIIIFLVIGIGGIYFYGDDVVTKAINDVTNSMVYLDRRVSSYTLIPLSVTYINVYKLENPSNIDIFFSYYAEAYYQGEYMTTMEFEKLIPSKRSITVEIECSMGSNALEKLIGLEYVTYHYIGTFKATGKFLLFTYEKSWSSEWDWDTSNK